MCYESSTVLHFTYFGKFLFRLIHFILGACGDVYERLSAKKSLLISQADIAFYKLTNAVIFVVKRKNQNETVHAMHKKLRQTWFECCVLFFFLLFFCSATVFYIHVSRSIPFNRIKLQVKLHSLLLLPFF